jgi:hypothetical protein
MMYCRKLYVTSSIRTIFTSIEKFLFVNDRTVNKKKLMVFLPKKLKTTQRVITTEIPHYFLIRFELNMIFP